MSRIAVQTSPLAPEGSNYGTALAGELFDQFCDANTFQSIMSIFQQMCEALDIKPNTDHVNFYRTLKNKIKTWKAQSLWAKLDKRAQHRVYTKGNLCHNTRVFIIGGGPCGLRCAIEVALLGAKAVVVEKRDRFSRNNVLHLWPFLIHDLKALGAKKFFGKFCAGAIDHISIRTLQCILVKVALLLGVELHSGVSFDGLREPCEENNEKRGWRAWITPRDHPVSEYEFEVLIGADGKRNTLPGFKRKEFRGKLAIAITANFINSHTQAEARVEEISGVAFIFNQKFFKDLHDKTGIDLENIVYYKDETHYFVMTAKKQSLLKKGVLMEDLAETEQLLSRENVDQLKLKSYAREAANFSTNHQLPELDFAHNHYGQADVAMFDFTSLFAAEYSSRIIEKSNCKLLMALVGDSLLEPFWPTGSGCARGFLGALDSAWMIRSWASGKMTPLEVLAERESIYQLLSQTTPENLNKNMNQYTMDPNTRYRNLNSKFFKPKQMRLLYEGGDKAYLDQIVQQSEEKNKRYEIIRDYHYMLRWFQRQLEQYQNVVKILDLTTSWRSGLAFCALIHRFRPSLMDFFSLDPNEHSKNNQLAFDIAEKELGIAPIMSGEEMALTEHPDKHLLVPYLSLFYEIFKKETIKVPRRHLSPEVNKPSRSKSPGSRTGSLGRLSRIKQRREKEEGKELTESERDKLKRQLLIEHGIAVGSAKKRATDIEENHGDEMKQRLERFKDIDAKFHEADLMLRKGNLGNMKSGVRGQNKVTELAKGLATKMTKEPVKIKKEPSPGHKKLEPKPLIMGQMTSAEYCYFCKKKVYLMERQHAEGVFFHRWCLKCDYCNSVLRLGAYAFIRTDDGEAKFYCFQHYGLKKKVRKLGKRAFGDLEVDVDEERHKPRVPEELPTMPPRVILEDVDELPPVKIKVHQRRSAMMRAAEDAVDSLKPQEPLDLNKTPERIEFECAMDGAEEESELEQTTHNLSASLLSLDKEDEDEEDSDSEEESDSSDMEEDDPDLGFAAYEMSCKRAEKLHGRKYAEKSDSEEEDSDESDTETETPGDSDEDDSDSDDWESSDVETEKESEGEDSKTEDTPVQSPTGTPQRDLFLKSDLFAKPKETKPSPTTLQLMKNRMAFFSEQPTVVRLDPRRIFGLDPKPEEEKPPEDKEEDADKEKESQDEEEQTQEDAADVNEDVSEQTKEKRSDEEGEGEEGEKVEGEAVEEEDEEEEDEELESEDLEVDVDDDNLEDVLMANQELATASDTISHLLNEDDVEEDRRSYDIVESDADEDEVPVDLDLGQRNPEVEEYLEMLKQKDEAGEEINDEESTSTGTDVLSEEVYSASDAGDADAASEQVPVIPVVREDYIEQVIPLTSDAGPPNEEQVAVTESPHDQSEDAKEDVKPVVIIPVHKETNGVDDEGLCETDEIALPVVIPVSRECNESDGVINLEGTVTPLFGQELPERSDKILSVQQDSSVDTSDAVTGEPMKDLEMRTSSSEDVEARADSPVVIETASQDSDKLDLSEVPVSVIPPNVSVEKVTDSVEVDSETTSNNGESVENVDVILEIKERGSEGTTEGTEDHGICESPLQQSPVESREAVVTSSSTEFSNDSGDSGGIYDNSDFTKTVAVDELSPEQPPLAEDDDFSVGEDTPLVEDKSFTLPSSDHESAVEEIDKLVDDLNNRNNSSNDQVTDPVVLSKCETAQCCSKPDDGSDECESEITDNSERTTVATEKSLSDDTCLDSEEALPSTPSSARRVELEYASGEKHVVTIDEAFITGRGRRKKARTPSSSSAKTDSKATSLCSLTDSETFDIGASNKGQDLAESMSFDNLAKNCGDLEDTLSLDNLVEENQDKSAQNIDPDLSSIVRNIEPDLADSPKLSFENKKISPNSSNTSGIGPSDLSHDTTYTSPRSSHETTSDSLYLTPESSFVDPKSSVLKDIENVTQEYRKTVSKGDDLKPVRIPDPVIIKKLEACSDIPLSSDSPPIISPGRSLGDAKRKFFAEQSQALRIDPFFVYNKDKSELKLDMGKPRGDKKKIPVDKDLLTKADMGCLQDTPDSRANGTYEAEKGRLKVKADLDNKEFSRDSGVPQTPPVSNGEIETFFTPSTSVKPKQHDIRVSDSDESMHRSSSNSSEEISSAENGESKSSHLTARQKAREEARRRARLMSDEQLGLQADSYIPRKPSIKRSQSLRSAPQETNKPARVMVRRTPSLEERSTVWESPEFSETSPRNPSLDIQTPISETKDAGALCNDGKSDRNTSDNVVTPVSLSQKSGAHIRTDSQVSESNKPKSTIPSDKHGSPSDHTSPESPELCRTLTMSSGTSTLSNSSGSGKSDHSIAEVKQGPSAGASKQGEPEVRRRSKGKKDDSEEKKEKRRSFLAMLLPSKGDKKEKQKSPPQVKPAPESSDTANSTPEKKAPGKQKTQFKGAGSSKDRKKDKKRNKKSSDKKEDDLPMPVFSQMGSPPKPSPLVAFLNAAQRVPPLIQEPVQPPVVEPPPKKDDNLIAPKASMDECVITDVESEFDDTASICSMRSQSSIRMTDKYQKKLKKAAAKQQRQAELKRLRMAQEIQRTIEEVDMKMRDVEERGIAIEKTLHGTAPKSVENETELMEDWFNVVHEKNALVRYQSELMVHARELELEDRQARLQQQLRDMISGEDGMREREQKEREQHILAELLDVVEQRDALVAMLEEDRLRSREEDREMKEMMLRKGFQLSPISYNLRIPSLHDLDSP